MVSENLDEPAISPTPRNPLRRIALIVVLLALVLFVLSVFMERRTPSTSQAQVQAYIVGIAPEVTGRVVEVGVADNSRVEANQVLFRIDSERYQLAVDEAEAALASVGQSIGASTASVDAAQAKLVQMQADRDNLRDQYARATELVKRGVFSRARFDTAKSAYEQAEASVSGAQADLAKAKEQLGPAGNDNPELRSALAGLEKARLDLVRTIVRAPSAGVVTNLQLTIGKVVSAGQPAMTFIDAGTIWISAAFKENSLEKVAVGNRAEILFDALPGRLFPATVESVGFGVSQGSTDPNTGLPTIRSDTGWVQEAQRFPVRLIIEEAQRPKGGGVRYGSQVTVVIYTGDNPVTNAWGSLWIRIMSVVTYVN
ncbi:HlyD family secretion protein [Rhizobium laguerreae]|uniref:HlyD family secretion protein n=1 Tax=Rhizobium laguerreae TaxID=1076926 RepID=UPI001C907A7C|nr:HlyD family secretion protein [Rhizobium laguerreae]MBY3224166.1 HlyD family secretion protein [Rhizobium laguerreae]MBY3234153.1 HlyD family secretion protein [Rhizobium laguerreae]